MAATEKVVEVPRRIWKTVVSGSVTVSTEEDVAAVATAGAWLVRLPPPIREMLSTCQPGLKVPVSVASRQRSRRFFPANFALLVKLTSVWMKPPLLPDHAGRFSNSLRSVGLPVPPMVLL